MVQNHTVTHLLHVKKEITPNIFKTQKDNE